MTRHGTPAALPPPPGVGGAPDRRTRVRRSVGHATELILSAAAEVFVVKGFHGATIDDVARASGYSPAAIYKYFGSRDALFARLWSRVALRFESLLDESVRTQGPFVPRLRWLVTRLGLMLETEPASLVAFLAHRPFQAHPEGSFERQALARHRRQLRKVERFMADGIARGELRGGEPADYALLLLGLLFEFAHGWLVAHRHEPLPSQVERLVELFLRGAAGP